MHSRYSDADASRAIADLRGSIPPHLAAEPLALRTYTARLLGADTALVVHGGGNTSVKAQAKTLFPDVPPIDVLHIKGSGWDLATIEPPGHPAVRLAPLLAYRALPAMSDEDMVNELRAKPPRRERPHAERRDAAPRVPPAPLHRSHPRRRRPRPRRSARRRADLPRRLRRVARLGPVRDAGFTLAKRTAEAYEAAVAEGRSPTVIILERHGIFTFGATAKESYERMIAAVTRAEGAIGDRSRTVNLPADSHDAALSHKRARGTLPHLRGVLAKLATRSPSVARSSSCGPASASARSWPATTSPSSFRSAARHPTT